MEMQQVTHKSSGFTLIELSIVLVVIGLLVGGVLVGRDLTSAAAVRSQISQIEKYQTAVNTFRGKYNGLPGDMEGTSAARYGLASRIGTQGRGDGNGIIEGIIYSSGASYGWQQSGETLLFWRDLSDTRLLAESLSVAADAGAGTISTTALSSYLPTSKVRDNAYLYVFSNCSGFLGTCAGNSFAGFNFFALTKISSIASSGLVVGTDGALTVSQSYSLDRKMDDGLPTKGRVQAWYPSAQGITAPGVAPSAATSDTSTCYETSTNGYSITQNNGAGMNCALSFKFQ